MSREVVVYMSPWCSSSADTQRALAEWGVPAKFVNIKEDRAAATRLREMVGFESVPTVICAEAGSVEPCEPPVALAKGGSPRPGPRERDHRGKSRATAKLAGQARIPHGVSAAVAPDGAATGSRIASSGSRAPCGPVAGRRTPDFGSYSPTRTSRESIATPGGTGMNRVSSIRPPGVHAVVGQAPAHAGPSFCACFAPPLNRWANTV